MYSTGTVYSDNYNGFSSSSVVISGVTINSGAITNVSSINGNVPDTSTIVTLANNTTPVTITGTATTGCYQILIKATYTGGPMASFVAAKAIVTDANNPNRMTSAVGSSGERLTLTWTASNSI